MVPIQLFKKFKIHGINILDPSGTGELQIVGYIQDQPTASGPVDQNASASGNRQTVCHNSDVFLADIYGQLILPL